MGVGREDTHLDPSSERNNAMQIVRRLRENQHVAYFAGGCVRDTLMGLTPKDYDVATDAPPPRVRQLFARTQAVGAAFGVILVRQGGSVVEVATFRTDLAYHDGRRPSDIRFATAEEDARRRDFTINGLFFDPIDNRVIDYVGGQQDIRNRVLRAIGDADQRFREDHLRLLRAVRFAARFNLTIEPATHQAMLRHAEHLKRISPERIGEELRLMLTPPSRAAAWRMLWQFKLMQVIFRALPEHPITPLPADRRPLFPELSPGCSVPFGLALAAMLLCYRRSGEGGNRPLIHLLEREEVRRAVHAYRAALKISNDEADMMTTSLSLAPLLRDQPPGVAQLKRFLAQAYSDEARALLDALSRSEPAETRIAWLLEESARLLAAGHIAPPPLITGDDLTSAGLRPGPLFKRVLDQVYDAQLEDRVTSKPAAMELAMALAGGQ